MPKRVWALERKIGHRSWELALVSPYRDQIEDAAGYMREHHLTKEQSIRYRVKQYVLRKNKWESQERKHRRAMKDVAAALARACRPLQETRQQS